MLQVNEIFETIQGEATYTGMPSVFVRMQGCPVGCPWCDTKHTWKTETKNVIPVVDMTAKIDDSPTFANVDAHVLCAYIAKNYKANHIVITGGEPALQEDLYLFTSALIATGCSVQIETSGHFPVKAHGNTFITVSPKMGMPNGDAIPEVVAGANEIKWPVGKAADIEKLKAMLSVLGNYPTVWLQPISQSKKATALCVEQATENGWRISLQTHKYADLR